METAIQTVGSEEAHSTATGQVGPKTVIQVFAKLKGKAVPEGKNKPTPKGSAKGKADVAGKAAPEPKASASGKGKGKGKAVPEKLLDPELEQQVRNAVTQVNEDLEQMAHAQFNIGDTLNWIKEALNLTLTDVHKRYFPERHYDTICILSRNAKAYNHEERAKARAMGASYREIFSAQAQRTRLVKMKQKPEEYHALDALKEIMEKRDRMASPKAVVRKTIKAEKKKVRAAAWTKAEAHLAAQPQGSWTEQFRQMKFQDAIRSGLIAPRSLTGAWFDMLYPYNQPGGARRTITTGGSGLDDEVAFMSNEEIIQTYVEGINLVMDHDLLADNGWMMIWTGGGESDEPVIVETMRARFGYSFPLYWKKSVQAGAQYKVFGVSTERVHFCARSRAAIDDWLPGVHRSQLLHENVEAWLKEEWLQLDHKSPTRAATARFANGKEQAGHTSVYEKPVDLCRYILEKLTLPDQLVWDMCGNRATMVEACIQANRRWFYTEIDEGCYGMGFERIRTLMEPKALKNGNAVQAA